MSRLATLSPAAVKAMFSPDADDTLITLLTLTGTGIATPIRLANSYLTRISETADEVVYGVVSRSNNYLFIPFNLSLPTDEHAVERQCDITIHDVTRYLIPSIRSLAAPPSVLVELVLRSAPDTVEISFGSFRLTSIKYNRDNITAKLTDDSLTVEPFPQHTFTPSVAPGLF